MVSMKGDRADTKICTAEIDCKESTLWMSAVAEQKRSICTFSVPFGTAVIYVGIWLICAPCFPSPSFISSMNCFTPLLRASFEYVNSAAIRLASFSRSMFVRAGVVNSSEEKTDFGLHWVPGSSCS